MNIRLIGKILTEPFLIDVDVAHTYAPLFLSLIKGKKTFEQDWGKERENNKSYIITPDGSKLWSYTDGNIPTGSMAIIPIRGEIMKYSEFCGPKGSMELTKDVLDADANENISSIIFIIDSPGGQVTHTDILSKTIKECKTPTIAFVEGMAASAAYWIASSTNKIIASSEIDRIGSIGTMMMYADLKPFYEEMGVKFHEVYASKSTDKNRDFQKILKGEYDDYRTNTLDFINNQFHDAVKENRPNISTECFSGKVYFAKEAMELGLIDSIGTLEYAIEEAKNFNSETLIHNNNMNIKFKDAWASIKSFFSFESATEGDEAAEIVNAEETIDNLQNELSARQTTIEEVTQERDTAVAALQTANTERETAKKAIETANARIVELETENAALISGAGAESAQIKAETELAGSEGIDADQEYLRTHTIAEGIAYMSAKGKK